MIPDRIADAIEQLVPVIERHDLAVSGRTAAGMYAMTVEPSDTVLDLVTVDMMAPIESAELAQDLGVEMSALADSLAQPGRGVAVRGKVDVNRLMDRAIATIPDTEDRVWLAVDIAFDDPVVQPASPRPTPVRRGGMRVPTLDQTLVARQAFQRWADHPCDLFAATDLGLAADRVGAHQLLTDQTVTDEHARYLGAATETLACRPGSPVALEGGTSRRAVRGLRELQAEVARQDRHVRAQVWR